MSKKAILVVSFGTSYPETRKKTIEGIEEKLDYVFPDRDLFRAWTSSFIIKKVARDQGLEVMTPEKALSALAEEGYTDVLVQPTHLTDGYENRRLIGILQEQETAFETVRLGRPLLFLPEDKAELVEILDEIYPRQTGEALVLMGHGSEDRPTPDYEELNALVADRQVPDIMVGTVEGEPGLAPVETGLKRLKRLERLEQRGAAGGANDGATNGAACGHNGGCAVIGIRRLILAPLMIVAGDHANNDLAGAGPDSWKSILEARGYETRVSMQGLGEFDQIRDMFARHATEATPLAEWR
jgi:sirohydrochlorin cobaltochelatase